MIKITANILRGYLAAALKTFGEYSYDDKGPHEVMDIPGILREFAELTPEEGAAILKDLVSSADSRQHRLVDTLWNDLPEGLYPNDPFDDGESELDPIPVVVNSVPVSAVRPREIKSTTLADILRRFK